MELDKVDAKLLDILQKDSSTPFVEIAKRIGVTDGTIHQRVKKLKKSGIIKRFTILADQEKLGRGAITYVLLSVKPGYIESVSKEVSTYESVLEVHEVHTQGDLLIKIRASSQEDIRDIIVNKIRTVEGLVNSDLFPVYKIWKEEV